MYKNIILPPPHLIIEIEIAIEIGKEGKDEKVMVMIWKIQAVNLLIKKVKMMMVMKNGCHKIVQMKFGHKKKKFNENVVWIIKILLENVKNEEKIFLVCFCCKNSSA